MNCEKITGEFEKEETAKDVLWCLTGPTNIVGSPQQAPRQKNFSEK